MNPGLDSKYTKNQDFSLHDTISNIPLKDRNLKHVSTSHRKTDTGSTTEISKP